DSPVPKGVTAIKITDAEWQACLSTPGYTVANGALVAPAAPTSAQLLAQAQAAQIASLSSAYRSAIVTPVSYTSKGGVTKTYQADPASQTLLMQATQGYGIAGATPTGFYWKSEDNTEVPFTLADLQGLYMAMLSQGWTAFQHLQSLKSQVSAATSISAVQAITW
ncbi:MAG: DUF4376 domain-containing protein, partial [Pseudomonadota bacterium]|nr:DUF4376 domain-containing protein [Pseudomonadota bacterium]